MGGAAMDTRETVMLVPPVQYHKGFLWSNFELPSGKWRMETDISIKEGTGGGGIGFWFTDKFVQRGNLVQTSSLFYITSGTTTITGGTFNFNVEGKLDSGLPVYCAGGSVAISGGTFTGYVTEMISSWGGTGSASVTGGTFDKDPVYVADGYKAVENNGVWTVVAE